MAEAANGRQKLALVTGASRGIGGATARRLAADGYHVILTARTEKGLVETEDAIHAAGGSATIAPVDLLNGDDIDRLGAAIAGRWQALDLLVLNAATLGTLTPLAHAAPKEFDTVMALNVTAQYRLIRAFDPLLRMGRGTLVAVSSSVATRAEAYWAPYSASKAALENMAGVYAAEMQALGVNVLLVDPGGTRTTMRARAYPGEDPQSLKTPDVVADAIADALPTLGKGLTRLKVAKDGTPTLSAAA
jgi:NAD(P)-dependent dehydrogenase (short-subunit alcohol dehydrogenase family)